MRMNRIQRLRGAMGIGDVGRKSKRARRAMLRVEMLEGRRLLSADVGHEHEHGPAGVDVMYGYYTPEEMEILENVKFNTKNSTKTPAAPAKSDNEDSVTFVLDFKEPGQGNTTDIFGNTISFMDVTGFGFAASDFDTVVQAVMAEIHEDYFDELVGTVAGPVGQELDVNFIVGDIGTPPPGYSEYYYVQIGTGASGPHTGGGILGVAGGSVVRNVSGTGPNSGIQTGDVVASIFTDVINSMGGLSPSNALTSGNLGFTTYAIVGTTAHEVGHTVSLSHINKAGSVQPSGTAGPIMGTGAIDMPNIDRIADREFSLSGVDGQNGNAPRQHVQQLVDALGLRDVVVDDPPAALAAAGDIFLETSDPQLITVTYTAGLGIDVSDLGTGDIVVTGPGGYSEVATYVGVDNNTDGTPRVATYSVPGPSGIWDVSANGVYTISIVGGEVSDTAETVIGGGQIGAFDVDVVVPLGPDGFGYTASPAPFVYNDISGSGTLVLENQDDEVALIQPAGFEFSVYGQTFNEVWVSSNGLVTFGGSDSFYLNSDMTTNPTPITFAPLWDDMASPAGKGVFWQLVGTGNQQQLIMQWETQYFNSAGAISFQAVLDESDMSMTAYYLDLAGNSSEHDEGISATVAIKDAGNQGANRLVAAFNDIASGYVGSGRAIRFAVENAAPVDIEIAGSGWAENLAAGATIGTFTAIDPDAGDTHTFALVPGTGDDDNATFEIVGSELRTLAVADFETKSSYNIRVQAEDERGAVVEKEFVIDVLDLVESATVVVGDGTAQRSRVDRVVVTFDGPVDIAAGAFVVNKRGVGGGAVTTGFSTQLDGQGRTVATVTFSGGFTRTGGAGILVDGNYDLVIDSSKVTRNGLMMDGDMDGVEGGDISYGTQAADKFFALYGDVNGDRSLTFPDFLQFRAAYGTALGQAAYRSALDFTGNGAIDFSDFLQFRSRYGTTLNFA